MRKPPQGDWRSVDRGTRRPGIELRNQVVWDADAVKALACGRHFGKALSWPYVGPRVLSSYFATYVSAVACTSRAPVQPLHIRAGALSVAMENHTVGLEPERLVSFSRRPKEWRPLIAAETRR